MKEYKIKDKKLKKLIGASGRKDAFEDFSELIKRAVRYKKLVK